MNHGERERRSSVLIDRQGELVELNDRQISERVTSRMSRAAVVDFFVTNLGWIELRRGTANIWFRCRPRVVSDTTLTSFLFELSDHPRSSLAVSVLGDEWRHFVHISRREVLALIDGLRTESQQEPFLLRRQHKRSSSRHGQSAGALSDYCATPRSSSEVIEFCNKLFAGTRWSMSHFESNSLDVTMDYVSNGFTCFNSRWIATYGSSSLDDYAGRDYALWVARVRAEALSGREAIFDEVDASVPFPGLGFSRLRYNRATVPIRLADGAMRVVATTSTDLSINLKEAG